VFRTPAAVRDALLFLDTEALLAARVRGWPGEHIFVPHFIKVRAYIRQRVQRVQSYAH
jgi:hypothetical protein